MDKGLEVTPPCGDNVVCDFSLNKRIVMTVSNNKSKCCSCMENGSVHDDCFKKELIIRKCDFTKDGTVPSFHKEFKSVCCLDTIESDLQHILSDTSEPAMHPEWYSCMQDLENENCVPDDWIVEYNSCLPTLYERFKSKVFPTFEDNDLNIISSNRFNIKKSSLLKSYDSSKNVIEVAFQPTCNHLSINTSGKTSVEHTLGSSVDGIYVQLEKIVHMQHLANHHCSTDNPAEVVINHNNPAEVVINHNNCCVQVNDCTQPDEIQPSDHSQCIVEQEHSHLLKSHQNFGALQNKYPNCPDPITCDDGLYCSNQYPQSNESIHCRQQFLQRDDQNQRWNIQSPSDQALYMGYQHQDDVKGSMNQKSVDIIVLFGVLLYVLTRCYGARWSSDLFRTISIRQRVHQEIAEKAESDKRSPKVHTTVSIQFSILRTNPIAALLRFLINRRCWCGDNTSCELGFCADANLHLKEVVHYKQFYKRCDYRRFLIFFLSLCSIINGVWYSAINLNDDDLTLSHNHGHSHYTVMFYDTNNMSNGYLLSCFDDATPDLDFNKKIFNFKLVYFAIVVTAVLITINNHFYPSVISSNTEFKKAHKKLAKLNTMKKKTYRDFMYIGFPCLTLELVHYLPTDNCGMFRRLHNLEHYKKHLSSHFNSPTSDMSHLAKLEHYTTTDDHYKGAIPYSFITSDHRLVASGTGMMLHKKINASQISHLQTALQILAVGLLKFYHSKMFIQVPALPMSRYNLFQWLPVYLANVCDHGDGSYSRSFAKKKGLMNPVHLLCKLHHWYPGCHKSVLLCPEINITSCSDNRNKFYQAVNNLLPLVVSVVNISLEIMVYLVFVAVVGVVCVLLVLVCGLSYATSPNAAYTSRAASALHTDIQECIVQQHHYDNSSACLVTGRKRVSESSLECQNLAYSFAPPSTSHIVRSIRCEDDVPVVACVEEVNDQQCTNTDTVCRNALHSFEEHEPKKFTSTQFISEQPSSHADVVPHNNRDAEECSDDKQTYLEILQEEVTHSLENSTSSTFYEELSNVPESIPVSESCHGETSGDIITTCSHTSFCEVVPTCVVVFEQHNECCNLENNDIGSDNSDDNDIKDDESGDVNQLDDGDDEDDLPDQKLKTNGCDKDNSSYDGSVVSWSCPPQEYNKQRSELAIPCMVALTWHCSCPRCNDLSRPIGDTGKPQPSHTNGPVPFEGSPAERDGVQPKPVLATSTRAQLPSNVVPDCMQIVHTPLPHSVRHDGVGKNYTMEKATSTRAQLPSNVVPDCMQIVHTPLPHSVQHDGVGKNYTMEKDYLQHNAYDEKDGRLHDATINIGATALSPAGGFGLDAQLIKKQPAQLEHLPGAGPQYDYLYDTKFEEDVPVSYEEVKQKTNIKTTFQQHEIEQRSHKPRKSHHNTQQPQHVPAKSTTGVVKTKSTLPKRCCIVIGDKQFPLDSNLLAHPHMDHYFVKDRTEIKPGHFLARLNLHHDYLDKLDSSEVTTAAQRSQAAIAVADSAVEKDGAVTERRHFPLNVNRTGYVVFSSDLTRFSGNKKYPLPSRKAAAVKLGKGGNGFVFSIFHNGKEYAVKKTVYRPSEIRVHSRLDHANLVNLDAVLMGEEHERHRGKFYAFCFMPKMDMDFRSVISTREHGCLKHLKLQLVEQRNLWELVMVNVKYVLRSILKALDYMHNQGLVHRDVKASNVLLKMHCQCTKPLMCACPQKFSVKLGDFDSSTTVPGFGLRIEPHQMIRYASVLPLGTMGYRAPEVSMHLVISGPYEVLYTTGVDIWSFGCLLLNMLIGKAGPLKQRGEAALLLSTQEEPYSEDLYNQIIKVKELQKYYSDVPELVDLVRKCLQVEVHCRPTAKQLLQLDVMQC